MENDNQAEQGRFTHRYLHDGRYPDGYTKRAKFFCARGADLFYGGGASSCKKKAAQKCRGKHAFIHVYCMCGLPESYDTHMIEFEQYQKCFHFKWMKLVTEPDSWVCPQCA